jgi:hypothetical protein
MRIQSWKCVFALPFISLMAAGSARADYCINKDLINLGPTAYDIAVLITPAQPVTFHYDGWAGGLFSSFTATPAGTDELLHWQNLNGTGDPIPTGDPFGPAQVHIGWCTLNPNNISNMYWTDAAGNQIPGSVVYQVGGHASANSTPGVQWDNASNHPITVTNVYYTLSSTPWHLADLNDGNRVLARALVPLPGGTTITIGAGKSVQLPVPNAKKGNWIVLVHGVTGSGTQARVKDFVQFQFGATSGGTAQP